MEEEVLHSWKRLNAETNDPVAAAILAIGCLLIKNSTRKTGLTSTEACKFLGVCDRTLRDLCTKGEIKNHRFGRSVRFNIADLEAFQRRTNPVEEAHPDSHLSHFNRKKSCSTKKQPLVSS